MSFGIGIVQWCTSARGALLGGLLPRSAAAEQSYHGGNATHCGGKADHIVARTAHIGNIGAAAKPRQAEPRDSGVQVTVLDMQQRAVGAVPPVGPSGRRRSGAGGRGCTIEEDTVARAEREELQSLLCGCDPKRERPA